MALAVATDDSYATDLDTPLLVGHDTTFTSQGTAADVDAVGFVSALNVGAPVGFVDTGTAAQSAAAGFAGSVVFGLTQFGAAADVDTQGFAGSLAGFLDGVTTPHQMSLVVDASPYSQSATATCRFRKSVDITWTTGHPLFRVQPSESTDPAVGGPVEDVFAWPIIDLEAETSYDVEVTVDDGSPVVFSMTATTKALPSAAGVPNKTITNGSTSGQIQTAFDNLVAGDVIEFEDGTYTITGVTLDMTGTEGSPIYIRGESRDGVILSRSSDELFTVQDPSNVVFENCTITGSGTDSGTAASSVAFLQASSFVATNLTIRNIICTGVDRFIDLYENAEGVLVYDNTITGNNEWSRSPTDFLGSNITWDDAGIKLPGNGNCAFNNTIEGFGDTFSYASHAGNDVTAPGSNIHFYRNDIVNSCDDPIEVDHAIRNCTWYDNRITNSINIDSIDPLYGGPWLSARNVCINPYRVGTHKWNDQNTGQFLYNNTVVATVSNGVDADVANWYQPNNGPNDYYGYQNNLHVYRGTGQSVWIESGGHTNLDFSNNAWYPDRQIQWGGVYSDLADAQANIGTTTPIFSGKQRFEDDVIVTSDPFDTNITLGADSETEVTTKYTPIISSGNSKNAGVVIPNITDDYSGIAPDIGAIIEGRDIPLYGDRSSLPSWYPSIGDIVEISSGTTVGTAARADGANSFAGSDPDDICTPWCGGALVYISGIPYLIAYGGGHNDSAYNGILKFGPLTGTGSDNPTWSVFLASSSPGAVQNGSTYTDGRQSSCHTYNNLVGVGENLYAMATHAFYNNGFSSDEVFSFTPSGQTALANNTTTGLFGCCDHYNGDIYYFGGNDQFDQLRIYDIGGDSWSTEPNGIIAFPNYIAGACDTNRGGFYVCNGSSAAYWDISGAITRQTGKNVPSSYHEGIIFDANRDVFVSHVSGSASVRELDASAINTSGGNPSWTTRPFGGDTPSASTGLGVYGRFQYVPELNGYILAPSLESSVYFYRSS